MKYICLECGCKFDVPKTWQESRGEYWGIPCSETMAGCPVCEGDFEENIEIFHYWISAYDDFGNQFGVTLEASDDDEMEMKFKEMYPDGNIADYGTDEELENE